MSNQINLDDVLPTMEQALEAAAYNAGLPLFAPCEQNGRLYVFGCYREHGETHLFPHRDVHGNITSFPLSGRRAARRYCDWLNMRMLALPQRPVGCGLRRLACALVSVSERRSRMTSKRGRPRTPRKRGRPAKRQPQQGKPRLPYSQVIDLAELFTSSYPLPATLCLLAERYQGNPDFEQGQGDGRALFEDASTAGTPLEDIPTTLYEVLGADLLALVGQGGVVGAAPLPAGYQAYLWGCLQGCLAAACAEADRQEREDMLAALHARRAVPTAPGEATDG